MNVEHKKFFCSSFQVNLIYFSLIASKPLFFTLERRHPQFIKKVQKLHTNRYIFSLPLLKQKSIVTVFQSSKFWVFPPFDTQKKRLIIEILKVGSSHRNYLFGKFDCQNKETLFRQKTIKFSKPFLCPKKKNLKN